MLVHLKSIEAISKVFNTGSKPVLVNCENMEDYVCKYDSRISLFAELTAALFLDKWGLLQPEYALINLQDKHIPINPDYRVPRVSFIRPCFGSKYSNSALLVTDLNASPDKSIRNDKNLETIFKIALFDTWIVNNDRNANNNNLLLENLGQEIGYRILPIDHGAVFDGCRVNGEWGECTLDDSILNSDFAKSIFEGKKNLQKYTYSLSKYYYLCISKCEQVVDNLGDLVPSEWELDIDELKNFLRNKLISNPDRLKNCLHELLKVAKNLN